MTPVGFEPTFSAGEWPQTYVLDRAATGTGNMEQRWRKISTDVVLSTTNPIQSAVGLNPDRCGKKPAANRIGTALTNIFSVNSNTHSLLRKPCPGTPPPHTRVHTSMHAYIHTYMHTRDVIKDAKTKNT